MSKYRLIEDKLYLITWIDAHAHSGWCDRQEMIDLCDKQDLTIETVGFFLKDTRDSLCFTMSIDKSAKTVDYVMQIPKIAIKKIIKKS